MYLNEKDLSILTQVAFKEVCANERAGETFNTREDFKNAVYLRTLELIDVQKSVIGWYNKPKQPINQVPRSKPRQV